MYIYTHEREIICWLDDEQSKVECQEEEKGGAGRQEKAREGEQVAAY